MGLFKYNEEALKFEGTTIRTYKNRFKVSVIVNILLICSILYLVNTPIEVSYRNIKGDTVYVNVLKKFTIKRFKGLIHQYNLKFPEVVYAQAVLESHFNSPVFKNNKNMFGMTPAHSRATVRVKTKHKTKYAVYTSWQYAVLDYALFQSRYMSKCKTQEEYLKRLGEVYAEDSNYANKLKYIIKHNQ